MDSCYSDDISYRFRVRLVEWNYQKEVEFNLIRSLCVPLRAQLLWHVQPMLFRQLRALT